jgi:outer membrane protein assembly factor BamB
VRSYEVATGTLRWVTTSPTITPTPHLCGVNRIATDGKTVVLAETGGLMLTDFQTEAYDAATGAWLWRNDRPGMQDQNLAVDTDHRIAFVTGQRFDSGFLPPGPSNIRGVMVVQAYDTRTGTLRWEDRFAVPPDPECVCIGFDVTAVKGRLFVVGKSITGTWVVRTYASRSGDLLWQDAAAPTSDRFGLLAVAAQSGRVFVAGSAFNATGNLDFILRAYDAE